MNADWLIGVERWTGTLHPIPRALVRTLMGLVVIGLCILGYAILFIGFFLTGDPLSGILTFIFGVIFLAVAANHYDKRRR
ncbi:MAG: hypothetical protein GEU71_12120 [Actinobacteria bacterium]|nr:hypothetical protein [Actinomycetota bacterium]